MAKSLVHLRTFEGQLEQLAPIREFVAATVHALGGNADDGFACELAVDEAATNFFQHAYAGERGKVEIKIWRDDADLFIQLRNWGKPFDPSEVPEPNFELPLEERRPGGLGLYLMRRVMQEVDFEFDSRHGNSVTLRRRLLAA